LYIGLCCGLGLARLPLDTLAYEVVTRSVGCVTGLAVRDGYAYHQIYPGLFTDEGYAVGRIALFHGQPETVATATPGRSFEHRPFALGAGYIYVGGVDGEIVRVARDDLDDTTVLETAELPIDALAVTSSTLLWASGSRIMARPLTGELSSVLIVAPDEPTALATDGDRIAWTARGATETATGVVAQRALP